MDRMEDFFAKHNADFHSEMPPLGHEARFMARYQQRNARSVHSIALRIASVAAAVLLTLSFTGLTAWAIGNIYGWPQMGHVAAPIRHLLYTEQINRQFDHLEHLAQRYPDILEQVQTVRHGFEAERISICMQMLLSSDAYLHNAMVIEQHAQMQRAQRLCQRLERRNQYVLNHGNQH